MGLGEVVVAGPGWNGLEEQGYVKAAGCLGCGQTELGCWDQVLDFKLLCCCGAGVAGDDGGRVAGLLG